MKLGYNPNCVIKVKLTDHGKDIYYHQYDHLYPVLKPTYPKEDESGYTSFQMWHFMELYGSHIGMCKPNVIFPLEIIIDSADLYEVTE